MNKENKKKLLEYKSKLIKEEKIRKTLLNKDIDLGLLETFVQTINNNENLQITIEYRDGTLVKINSYKKNNKIDPFIGE